MNFNASIYSNAVALLDPYFGVELARRGMVVFPLPSDFGCEFWTPLLWRSQSLARYAGFPWTGKHVCFGFLHYRKVLVESLADARVMCGLSSAGGCSTVSMVTDMFDKDDQEYAVL